MPIYEYRCEDCGTKFEKLVRRQAEVPGVECPSCGQKHLKQELSTFAAHSGGQRAEIGECPSGKCMNPGMCGMNMN
ncbi:MAG TPA: zinc ribbon domain-containing protein [Bryobacteraceae bacterium]|nr:zinc ribbon domain-containing protein [Bryobacteraceae bacterium]